MTLSKSDPLYDSLRPCRAWLYYADWRDVEAGNFEPVAERLRRRAKWWLYFSGIVTAGVALFGLHDLWQYFTVGGGGHLLSALFKAAILAVFVPLDLCLYRALVAPESRLRERAATDHEREVIRA